MIKIVKSILPKDQTYYVAVSMGIDSVAAVSFMKNRGYDVIPIHFNHNLRQQNQKMVDFFNTFCEDMNLNGIVGEGHSLTTEKNCRDARIDFFSSLCYNANVVTAHHLNDWVESYLINCFRGQPHYSPFNLISNFGSFSVYHPFLLTKKSDLIQYAERNKLLKYVVEDESNNITKGSRRNWLRNIIIPEMRKNKLSLEKFAQKEILKLVNLNITV
jgi:tRNA(Ile)-lysidine synthetase-like protein